MMLNKNNNKDFLNSNINSQEFSMNKLSNDAQIESPKKHITNITNIDTKENFFVGESIDDNNYYDNFYH